MSDLQWLGLLVLGCTLVLAIMVYVVYRWLAQQIIALHKSLLANIRTKGSQLEDTLLDEHRTTRNAVKDQGKSTRGELHKLIIDSRNKLLADIHIMTSGQYEDICSRFDALQDEHTRTRKEVKGTRPTPPENADGARCAATAKSTGKRCKKPPVKGKTVCREHTHTPENQPAPAQESSDG